MVVNLYVDHMMNAPAQNAEEVWSATREHAKLYSDAADRIGLSGSEYHEFQNALLDGKAIYVTLPRHIDAMAGNRHGYVYAVKHAYLPDGVMGWKVALSSGAVVYVPKVCGNLAVSRGPKPIVKRPHKRKVVAWRPAPPAPPAPPEQPVVFAPPAPIEVAPPAPPVPPAPAIVEAPVAPPSNNKWSFLFIPIVFWWHNTNNNNIPPCNQGSNAYGVCRN